MQNTRFDSLKGALMPRIGTVSSTCFTLILCIILACSSASSATAKESVVVGNKNKGCAHYSVTTISSSADVYRAGWLGFRFQDAGYELVAKGLHVWANPDPQYASGVRWYRWLGISRAGDFRLADLGKLQLRTTDWTGGLPKLSLTIKAGGRQDRIDQLHGKVWWSFEPILPPSGDPSKPYVGTLADVLDVYPDARVMAGGFLVGAQYEPFNQPVNGVITSLQLGCWVWRFGQM